ncbi:hypothetical protein CC85DRAFT_284996 [Cutaneotrichosporon oleaginosum]|uniref:Uncharacterized protein n=1 Tax=Cutaneotrichosporon oleaginosum TaxID=879819 RepID=A0A0J1B5Q3_9TREE|nr:uncharacterized protein CC85DRAFT_284996 [Cutaneotrichosporon oleaginosum]KLT43029.1 hypothetical protein CC85DRAFT_284996 [Cutaneotrichosporon oleaginosum]TXT11769.1 hypothetical protein COLE_02179 [Cutaneotrichosporon oleaginosum]
MCFVHFINTSGPPDEYSEVMGNGAVSYLHKPRAHGQPDGHRRTHMILFHMTNEPTFTVTRADMLEAHDSLQIIRDMLQPSIDTIGKAITAATTDSSTPAVLLDHHLLLASTIDVASERLKVLRHGLSFLDDCEMMGIVPTQFVDRPSQQTVLSRECPPRDTTRIALWRRAFDIVHAMTRPVADRGLAKSATALVAQTHGLCAMFSSPIARSKAIRRPARNPPATRGKERSDSSCSEQKRPDLNWGEEHQRTVDFGTAATKASRFVEQQSSSVVGHSASAASNFEAQHLGIANNGIITDASCATPVDAQATLAPVAQVLPTYATKAAHDGRNKRRHSSTQPTEPHKLPHASNSVHIPSASNSLPPSEVGHSSPASSSHRHRRHPSAASSAHFSDSTESHASTSTIKASAFERNRAERAPLASRASVVSEASSNSNFTQDERNPTVVTGTPHTNSRNSSTCGASDGSRDSEEYYTASAPGSSCSETGPASGKHAVPSSVSTRTQRSEGSRHTHYTVFPQPTTVLRGTTAASTSRAAHDRMLPRSAVAVRTTLDGVRHTVEVEVSNMDTEPLRPAPRRNIRRGLKDDLPLGSSRTHVFTSRDAARKPDKNLNEGATSRTRFSLSVETVDMDSKQQLAGVHVTVDNHLQRSDTVRAVISSHYPPISSRSPKTPIAAPVKTNCSPSTKHVPRTSVSVCTGHTGLDAASSSFDSQLACSFESVSSMTAVVGMCDDVRR